MINCCKFLYLNLICLFVNGVTFGSPIDSSKQIGLYSNVFLIQNLFSNPFKQANTEKFKQWET